jgi:PleD family two-component response regulator
VNAQSRSSELSEVASAPRAKVLVVDDDRDVLELVRRRLQAAGYEVHVRETSLGTSQWIAEERPDLVLLDVRMPALSGGELATMIRKSPAMRGTGVILYSCLEESTLEELAKQSGALGAIPKTHDGRRFMLAFDRFALQHKKKPLER